MGCSSSKSTTVQVPTLKAASALQTQSNGIAADTSAKAPAKQPSPPVPALPNPQSKPPAAALSPEKPLSTNSSKQEMPGTALNSGKTPTRPAVSLVNQGGNEQIPEAGVELSNKGPLPERKGEPYDQKKTVKLSIGDLEGTFTLTTTFNLNKSTESLYAAVKDKLHHNQFTLIHQGKVLPADSTPLGAYGVHESGQVDCLFLSLKA